MRCRLQILFQNFFVVSVEEMEWATVRLINLVRKGYRKRTIRETLHLKQTKIAIVFKLFNN